MRHAFASCQAGLGEQGVVGGREGLGEPSGPVPVDGVGHGEKGALRHRHQLALAPTPGDGHDPVPEREPGGAGPEGVDPAGELEARDVLR